MHRMVVAELLSRSTSEPRPGVTHTGQGLPFERHLGVLRPAVSFSGAQCELLPVADRCRVRKLAATAAKRLRGQREGPSGVNANARATTPRTRGMVDAHRALPRASWTAVCGV